MAARVGAGAAHTVNPVGGNGAPAEDVVEAVRAVGAWGAAATATAGATVVSPALTSVKAPKKPAVTIKMIVFVFTPSFVLA